MLASKKYLSVVGHLRQIIQLVSKLLRANGCCAEVVEGCDKLAEYDVHQR